MQIHQLQVWRDWKAAQHCCPSHNVLTHLLSLYHSLHPRYYLSRHCAVCDELTHATKPLCERCTAQPQLAAAVLAARWGRLERQYAHLVRLCAHCGGGGGRAAAEGATAWAVSSLSCMHGDAGQQCLAGCLCCRLL